MIAALAGNLNVLRMLVAAGAQVEGLLSSLAVGVCNGLAAGACNEDVGQQHNFAPTLNEPACVLIARRRHQIVTDNN